MSPSKEIYSSVVFNGHKVGRTIDFPTINLDVTVIPQQIKHGVYASWVTIGTKTYKGALYFGPRLVFAETVNVLEIYILNFNQEIYGQEVSFTIEDFVRPPMDFASLDGLKQQLKEDISRVDALLTAVA